MTSLACITVLFGCIIFAHGVPMKVSKLDSRCDNHSAISGLLAKPNLFWPLDGRFEACFYNGTVLNNTQLNVTGTSAYGSVKFETADGRLRAKFPERDPWLMLPVNEAGKFTFVLCAKLLKAVPSGDRANFLSWHNRDNPPEVYTTGTNN
ncbi:uncharacterized protein LOC141900280 [Tubulanus polymorphus]|uniref:uncharacterized protein LOC141900280 n=1 Tax=Tubulanus polymorphus TaxID=672921 RepID=UPI003DA52EA1